MATESLISIIQTCLCYLIFSLTTTEEYFWRKFIAFNTCQVCVQWCVAFSAPAKYWIPFSQAVRILNIMSSGLLSGCEKIQWICCTDFLKFCIFCWYLNVNSIFLKASSQYNYIKLKTSVTQIYLYGIHGISLSRWNKMASAVENTSWKTLETPFPRL